MNLLSNAIDAIQERKDSEGPHFLGQISISIGKDGNQMIYIAIEDNGYGIPMELRERVLESFFTTKDVGSGTGLGLSISNKIIQNHSGKLLIEDGKNLEGARFVILIPESGTA